MGAVKTIHLIRHAKSSWEDPFLADIDRPLNERGIRTSRFMAQHIHEAGCSFENIFCSPAKRAQSTISLISESLPLMDIEWQTDQALYTFYDADLINWLETLDDAFSDIVLVGHNPAFTQVCNRLSDTFIKNIPTCGYVRLKARAPLTWQEITQGSFELAVFLRPKKLIP